LEIAIQEHPTLRNVFFSVTLCRYINGVKPGEYGTPEPFYFPILPSYWTGKPRGSKIKDVSIVIYHILFHGRKFSQNFIFLS